MKYLEIYDTLRQAHSLIKDILGAPRYNNADELLKTAIDGVHSALYMAEHRAAELVNGDDDRLEVGSSAPMTVLLPQKPAEPPAAKRRYKQRVKPAPRKAGKRGTGKRAGFPPGSRFFDCEDCKMGFATTEQPMDAQCKHCGSFHVHLREKKSDQSTSAN